VLIQLEEPKFVALWLMRHVQASSTRPKARALVLDVWRSFACWKFVSIALIRHINLGGRMVGQMPPSGSGCQIK